MTRKRKSTIKAPVRLTVKQLAFVNAYLGDAHYCAAKAARMIGSQSNYAAWQRGYRMMRNPAVRAAVEAGVDAQMRLRYPEYRFTNNGVFNELEGS